MTFSFAAWMKVGVPVALLGGVFVYLALTRFLVPLPTGEGGALPGGQAALDRLARGLGAITYPERVIAGVFGVVALSWMTRSLLSGLVPGLSDSLIAIAGALVLFAWPARQGSDARILDADVLTRLPWSVLLLFGGGLSLAGAVEATGLATWIGEALEAVGTWPLAFVVALVVAVVILLTELTSNTATAAAFLPVLGALAVGIGQHPLQLLVPATLAVSCAFMLPVATPPNAIVYGSGVVRIQDMARVGVWLNLAFVVLLTALAFTLVPLVFDLGTMPSATP
jgi:sodium-dependent dicarboxylate transporter 2/3/5